MAPTQPSPATWTIRFRLHKTTVLLPIDPLQPISSIKSDLWSALQQTSPDGTLSDSTPLPDSSDDILLARPIDINDAAAGWKALTVPGGNDGGGGGAAKKGKGKAGEGLDAESLKSLGIKDNALLAFTFASSTQFRSQPAKNSRVGTDGGGSLDDDTDGMEGLEDEDGETKEEWDVVMPGWEDQYGVVNVGDAGALKEFDG